MRTVLIITLVAVYVGLAAVDCYYRKWNTAAISGLLAVVNGLIFWGSK